MRKGIVRKNITLLELERELGMYREYYCSNKKVKPVNVTRIRQLKHGTCPECGEYVTSYSNRCTKCKSLLDWNI